MNYSVGHYVADVARLLEAIEPGRVPIFVGGTGLYFKALAEGLSRIPPVPDEVRDVVRRTATAAGRRNCTACWPSAIRRPRAPCGPPTGSVQRALEVFAATGRPLVSFHAEREPGLLAGRRLVTIFLAPDRDLLRRRIDQRFETMLENGALDEVRALGERRLDPMLPVMRAHGVPGLLAHLRGELRLEDAIAKGKVDTRAYAKRQFTWFRHQLISFAWVAPERGFEAVMAALNVPASR